MAIYQYQAQNHYLKRVSGNAKGDVTLNVNSHNTVENRAVTLGLNNKIVKDGVPVNMTLSFEDGVLSIATEEQHNDGEV